MTLDFRITEEEIAAANEKTLPEKQFKKEKVVADAKKFLSEMGVAVARVAFIRDSAGVPRHGYTRLPLKVQTSDEVYVIKPYDSHNPQEERAVLATVQEKMAPRVIRFGNEMYAEDFIDPEKSKTLLSLAESGGLADAVEAGAETHAELAKLGVNYHHNHWLDEFHVIQTQPRKVMVTDFGTSRLFWNQTYPFEDPIREKEQLDLLQKGAGEYLEEFPFSFFSRINPQHIEVKNTLNNLRNENPYVLRNCLLAIYHAFPEIKNYIEETVPRVDAWGEALKFFPHFVKTFVDRYNS